MAFRESDVSGINEVTMNCQSCDTRIDYRFLTNCVDCGNALNAVGVAEVDLMPPAPPVEKRVTRTRRLINLVYVLASSIAGMISGAAGLYFGYALVCIMVLNHIDFDESPGTSCARGTAFAYLSIMIGAFLGIVGGTAFAVKKPLFKSQ